MLLLRPDHIGDVLLGAEAVALLRASLPSARLTYLVGPWSADAARRGPSVDEVRSLAYPGFTRRSRANALEPYTVLIREALGLRRERYQLAIVLRGDHWWGALLALLAGIPLRVGGDTPETAPLLTHAYAATPDEPAATRALGMARLALQACGASPVEPHEVTQFTIGARARAEADHLWRQHGLGQRVVAIQPSAGAPLKSWPTDRWAQLADALLRQHMQVILTGAPGDGPLLAQVAERVHGCAPMLYGQSLDVTAALFARCAVVVTVDGGAGHLAAAVGARTVRLYGPAPASVFGPWPQRAGQRVLSATALRCVPCGDLEHPPCGARATPACMLALGVDDVLNAIWAELGRS